MKHNKIKTCKLENYQNYHLNWKNKLYEQTFNDSKVSSEVLSDPKQKQIWTRYRLSARNRETSGYPERTESLLTAWQGRSRPRCTSFNPQIPHSDLKLQRHDPGGKITGLPWERAHSNTCLKVHDHMSPLSDTSPLLPTLLSPKSRLLLPLSLLLLLSLWLLLQIALFDLMS